MFCTGEEGNTKWSYQYTSSLEKLWLPLKLHISCMLPEWSFQKFPDVGHGAHLCPSQHQACLEVSSGTSVQKRVWTKRHWGFPGHGREQGRRSKFSPWPRLDSFSELFSLVAQSCPTLGNTMYPSLWLLCPWDFPGQNTGVGYHFLLQGIFPTQGLNPGLLRCICWATR